MFLFYKNENDYEGELDEEGKMHGFGVITSKKTKIKIAATFFKDGIEGFGKCPKPLLFIVHDKGQFIGGDMDGTISEFRNGLPYGKMTKNDT